MSEAPRSGSPDGNVDALRQRTEELTARVAELEAELGRRGATDATSRQSRESRHAEIEKELEGIERLERELRAERARLMEQYAEERSARSPKAANLQFEIDHLDTRLRELRMQRQQRLAELDQLAREPVFEQRYAPQPTYVPTGYAASGYAPASAYVGPSGYADPVLTAGAASYQAFDQLSRMGAGILYGHLAMLTSAADVLASLGTEIDARQRARGPVPFPEMVGHLYGDLYAGTLSAIDRVHRVPVRTIQGFHATGAGIPTVPPPSVSDPLGRPRTSY